MPLESTGLCARHIGIRNDKLRRRLRDILPGGSNPEHNAPMPAEAPASRLPPVFHVEQRTLWIDHQPGGGFRVALHAAGWAQDLSNLRMRAGAHGIGVIETKSHRNRSISGFATASSRSQLGPL